MAGMTKPCRCARYRFPHRYAAKCDDFIYAEREREYRGISDEERLRREDYHDRVRDLRRDLA